MLVFVESGLPPQKKSKILFEILNASSRSGRGYIALDGRLGLGLNQMIFNSSFDHYRKRNPWNFSKAFLQSKFHLTGRDRLYINEKGIDSASKHAFGFTKPWIAPATVISSA